MTILDEKTCYECRYCEHFVNVDNVLEHQCKTFPLCNFRKKRGSKTVYYIKKKPFKIGDKVIINMRCYDGELTTTKTKISGFYDNFICLYNGTVFYCDIFSIERTK